MTREENQTTLNAIMLSDTADEAREKLQFEKYTLQDARRVELVIKIVMRLRRKGVRDDG